MSAAEEIRNDYINDLADAANIETDQIIISSVELLDSVTGKYKITSEIEFYDLDETAVQALVTKINDKSAFTRLNGKHGSIESIPQFKRKTLSESDLKPKMISTKKKSDGTIVEKRETIRRKDGRIRERKFNPIDDTDILETTEISAEDEITGEVTTKITQPDGSYVETIKDSSDVIKKTIDASAPDATTGNITLTITDHVTGETTQEVIQ